MEYQQKDRKSVQDAESSGARAMNWVAPLESMTMFSIAEFTKTDTNPGDDSSGIFTQS